MGFTAAQALAFEIVTRSKWDLTSGAATDISVGANGDVWAIGSVKRFGGFGIHYWDSGKWAQVDGGAVGIAVGSNGLPWVVNDRNQIFRRVGEQSDGGGRVPIAPPKGKWAKMPGKAKDIAIGGDGTVWVIGSDPRPGGFGIYKWVDGKWERIEGGGVRIAVDPKGRPWVVNDRDDIYRLE